MDTNVAVDNVVIDVPEEGLSSNMSTEKDMVTRDMAVTDDVVTEDDAVTEDMVITEDNIEMDLSIEEKELMEDAAMEGKIDIMPVDPGYIDPGYGEPIYEEGTYVDPTMGGSIKNPLLSSWFFVIGISAIVLFVSVGLGALLARRKIKKGIELYED